MTSFAIITVVDKRQQRHFLRYDIANSRLTWVDTGHRISLERVAMSYAHSLDPWAHHAETNINPAIPGRKSGTKRLVKIQLGLKCNFGCSYCAQEPGQDKIITIVPATGKSSRHQDVEAFLGNLPNWLKPESGLCFELWGGEPFLYWKRLKPLAEGLLGRYPEAIVSIVTNGSLINSEIADWVIMHERVHLTVSHDGSGKYRDEDVLDNPSLVRLFHALSKSAHPMRFNCVLTTGNLSVAMIRNYLAARLDVSVASILLGTEGLITPFDEASQSLLPDTAGVSQIFRELVAGRGDFLHGQGFQEFFRMLAEERPASAIPQKCGLDRSDAIVVNLQSQSVVTCQNTLPIGKHRIGHVNDLDSVRLDTVWHWKSREKCPTCPVLAFCRGSCLYLEGDDFKRACESQLLYRLPFLCAAIYSLTGFLPIHVSWNWGEMPLDLLNQSTDDGSGDEQHVA